jgi:hypothetical protein
MSYSYKKRKKNRRGKFDADGNIKPVFDSSGEQKKRNQAKRARKKNRQVLTPAIKIK